MVRVERRERRRVVFAVPGVRLVARPHSRERPPSARHTDETVLLRDDEAGDTPDVSETGDPVAAARVLTDYVYYAMVYDVLRNAPRF